VVPEDSGVSVVLLELTEPWEPVVFVALPELTGLMESGVLPVSAVLVVRLVRKAILVPPVQRALAALLDCLVILEVSARVG
jgi:hypothetical protein